MAGEGGVYYTKFECILKATLMPTNRTRGARGGLKLSRTLVSFRHCLAEPRQPRKKNTPCFLDLAGVKFLLKVERTFFFGVLPSKYSGMWRNNADEVLAKLFFGESICQNFNSFVFEFVCRKWKRGGLGRNFPFAPLFSFGEIRAGNTKNQLANLICLKFWCNIIVIVDKWILHYNVNLLLKICQQAKI